MSLLWVEKTVLPIHEILSTYLEDWRGKHVGSTPIVILPKSSKAISEIIKICFEKNIAVIPTRRQHQFVWCQYSKFNKGSNRNCHQQFKNESILELDIHNQTLIAQSGCILSNIQNKAEEHGFLFPLSMGAEGTCQIGGNLSTNAGGVNVLKYGMSRELVMGLEVVLPDGSIFSD